MGFITDEDRKLFSDRDAARLAARNEAVSHDVAYFCNLNRLQWLVDHIKDAVLKKYRASGLPVSFVEVSTDFVTDNLENNARCATALLDLISEQEPSVYLVALKFYADYVRDPNPRVIVHFDPVLS